MGLEIFNNALLVNLWHSCCRPRAPFFLVLIVYLPHPHKRCSSLFSCPPMWHVLRGKNECPMSHFLSQWEGLQNQYKLTQMGYSLPWNYCCHTHYFFLTIHTGIMGFFLVSLITIFIHSELLVSYCQAGANVFGNVY